MERFADILARPLVEAVRPRVIAQTGGTTATARVLAAEAARSGAVLHVVDAQEGGAESFATVHAGRSLSHLWRLRGIDLAFLASDPNWYTVTRELEMLERTAKKSGARAPVVAVSGAGTLTGRRDGYRDPEAIPERYRQAIDAAASPGSIWLAERSGGPHNGVRTAIEDFLEQREGWSLVVFPAWGGLALVVPPERLDSAVRDLTAKVRSPEFLAELCDALDGVAEEARRTAYERAAALRERQVELQRLATELEGLRETLSAAENDVRFWEDRAGRGYAAAEQREEQREDLRADLVAARLELSTERAELGALKALIDEERAAAGARSAVLAAQVEEALAEAERAEAAALGAGDRLHEVEDRLAAATAEVERLTAERAALEAARERDERARRNLTSETESLRAAWTRIETLVERALPNDPLALGVGALLGAELATDEIAQALERLFEESERRAGAAQTRIADLEAELYAAEASALEHQAHRARAEEAAATADANAQRDRQRARTREEELSLDVVLAEARASVAARRDARALVTIVVPIYGAATELGRCLAALTRNTTYPAELLLIDDASADPDVDSLLEEYGRLDGVRVLRNTENLGFTRTVNRGLRHSRGDVVLLNSDTQVTPGWLERLARTAQSDPMIASVTPVSNNAGAFAVPEIGVPNETPAHMPLDDVGRLINHCSYRLLPETPTGNGFCMYITRAALDAVGEFDAVGFPRGYGEENDFSMRAIRTGFRHVVDDGVFVFHEREASFGAEKAELIRHGRKVLDERYPDYTERVRAFVRSDEMKQVRSRIAYAFEAARSRELAAKPRVLFVIHEGGGGAPSTNEDLMRALSSAWDCFVFTSNSVSLKLLRQESGSLEQLDEWRLERPWRLTDFSRPDYRTVATKVLDDIRPELVHVRHLFKHPFDLPMLAAERSIPIVMSFHDYYLSCPTVHLLDENDTYCGGQCTPGDGACRIPSPLLADRPHLKHHWIHEWREEVGALLDRADALVTTSLHTREVYRRSYPQIAATPFAIIEHGRDLEQAEPVATAPVAGERIRVLVAGNLDVHKGAEYIRAMREHDVDGRVEFHFLGSVPERYESLGVQHGRYRREEFAERARAIGPAAVGIFSITAETYCHGLTEAWAAGIPVVATDIGALGERVRSHGGGWLVPVDSPQEGLRRILRLADDPADWREIAERAVVAGLPTVDDMGADYDALYGRVREARRAFAEESTSSGSPTGYRRGVTRVCAIVPGAPPFYPGSTHVRLLRRFSHPSVNWKLKTRVLYGAQVESLPECDVAVVQRSALPPDAVEWFLDQRAATRTPLVVDLDDNLFERGEDDPDYGRYLPGLRDLLGSADLVTVSVDPLRVEMSELANAIEVVPNMLDERLWFADGPPMELEYVTGVSSLRLLYAGSRTHAQDIDLLEPVFTMLREAGVDAQLFVVGGEIDRADAWYSRVRIPPGATNYPRYVRWLRSVAPTFHGAVAPLIDDEFNRYKSDLKHLEYAALGLASVFSDVEPFSSVRDGVTGLVVPNEPERWVEAVMTLAADTELRSRIATSARDYVLSERTIRSEGDRFRRILSAVAEGSSRSAVTSG